MSIFSIIFYPPRPSYITIAMSIDITTDLADNMESQNSATTPPTPPIGETGPTPPDPTRLVTCFSLREVFSHIYLNLLGRVFVSGVDLSEFLSMASRMNTSLSCLSPMDRFLEGPGTGRMEKLIQSSLPPPQTARRTRKLRSRTTAASLVSMAVEARTSERS